MDRLKVIMAYADTVQAKASLRTRADIECRQHRLWRRLTPAIAATPALAALAGAPLDAFPIVEPRDLRAKTQDWNSRGLSAGEIDAAARDAEHGGRGEVRPGVVAGYSTGSTGARGVFVSTGAERARYLGQSLAKLLPGGILQRRRIGLCLRADNALYRDVANAGPFVFRYFSLAAEPTQRAREIETFAPDIFIAPSHVLADLARLVERRAFAPPKFERVFYGAEPMSASERDWITQALNARPDPIYQATEGFLGASCAHGALHLNEDSIHFEFERVDASDRFRPIITDLRRTTQPMARVRLDDLLQLAKTPCPCGAALQAVLPIEGRACDIWRWGEARIFPGDVEAALSDALPPSADWRAIGSNAGVMLACDAAHKEAAQQALTALLMRAGAPPRLSVVSLYSDGAAKRRRVQWSHG
jgi:putative adenylate-forming enzyme